MRFILTSETAENALSIDQFQILVMKQRLPFRIKESDSVEEVLKIRLPTEIILKVNHDRTLTKI